MNKETIVKIIGDVAGRQNIMIDEPMKNHTSFKVGGPADILVMPDSVEKLASIYKICREMQVPVFVMGNGTNLVVRDKGIRGVVVKLAGNFCSFEVKDDIIRAQAGIPISKVSKIALQHGLSGIEFAEGIPGTLGGAVFMNAGAYNGEMADITLETVYLDTYGNIKTLTGKEQGFGKRTSFIQQNGGIVIEAKLKLRKGIVSEIKALMDDFRKQRMEKQPLDMPSAGSIFKRPEGHFAGKLIQDCGLKGHRIGGAQVSSKHCGFIVNTGDARAEDIIELIKHIQEVVRATFGVTLETEVKIVGEE